MSFKLDAQDKEGVASECYEENNCSDDNKCDKHTITDEYDKKYCSMKQAYEDRIDKICYDNDTQLTQDEIYTITNALNGCLPLTLTFPSSVGEQLQERNTRRMTRTGKTSSAKTSLFMVNRG